ncbi:hypothetical protein QO004_006012 [Rhizobium mesoamericanum]|nr:hypothetical protein [Rhizobium mesoamericanum]
MLGIMMNAPLLVSSILRHELTITQARPDPSPRLRQRSSPDLVRESRFAAAL